MRLAADYQQINKNNIKKQTNERVNIIKLGKGIPIQEKRKRGISISQSNQKITELSLGKNEISKQKKMQQNLISSKKSSPNTVVPNKIISSAATYGQKQPVSSSKYYNNQLPPHQISYKQGIMPKTQNILRQVKSASILKRSPNYIQQHLNSAYCTVKNIARQNDNMYHNFKKVEISNAASIQKINFLPVNSQVKFSREIHIPNKDKIQIKYINSNRINLPILSPQKQIYSSNYQINLIPNQYQSKIHKDKKHDYIEQQISYNKHNQLMETMKNVDIKSNSVQEDNFHLINSKATQKNQYSAESRINDKESLQQTKKYLKNVTQIKELSNSNSIDGQSRQRIYNSKGGGFISLWDANKTQSIVSMAESRQIKIQQSEIMLDYFNPSNSMLKKL